MAEQCLPARIRPWPADVTVADLLPSEPAPWIPPVGSAGGSGARRIVAIGIDYIGTQYALSGCINDARSVLTALSALLPPASVSSQLLVDEEVSGASLPTQAAIVSALQWSTSSMRPGDRALLWYSGHGAGVNASDPADSAAIIPLDYITSGFNPALALYQTQLFADWASRVPQGACAFAGMDSCYSGDVINLRYTYVDASFRTDSDRAEAAPSPAANQNAPFVLGQWVSQGTSVVDESLQPTDGQVILLSGSTATGVSYEDDNAAQQHGAMTEAFLATLAAAPDLNFLSWRSLLTSIRGQLAAKGFAQIPQLCSGQPLDLDSGVGPYLGVLVAPH